MSKLWCPGYTADPDYPNGCDNFEVTGRRAIFVDSNGFWLEEAEDMTWDAFDHDAYCNDHDRTASVLDDNRWHTVRDQTFTDAGYTLCTICGEWSRFIENQCEECGGLANPYRAGITAAGSARDSWRR
jgi:hypothetical protein